MTRYLLDTNVVLRFCDPGDTKHGMALDAVYYLLDQGHECLLVTQILIEFWVVATRPVNVNGLGWTVYYTRGIIDQLISRFQLLEESLPIFSNWLGLVTSKQVMGKRTHDARIVAVMLAHKITHILTFNPDDFTGIADIKIMHPHDFIDR